MTLHLCIDCAVIYDCSPEHEKICPRCGQSLELREEPDKVATLAEVSGWATHGEAPRRRRLWSVE